MARVHLFELGDLDWFPRTFHQYETDYLAFIAETFGMLSRGFIAPITRLLDRAPERRIIDICSGGAGPWLSLLPRISSSDSLEPTVILTDISPNIPAMERVRTMSKGRIDFIAEPVDATAVPGALQGARTLFNGFHHLRPAVARQVLADAATKGQPIGVFERPAQ